MQRHWSSYKKIHEEWPNSLVPTNPGNQAVNESVGCIRVLGQIIPSPNLSQNGKGEFSKFDVNLRLLPQIDIKFRKRFEFRPRIKIHPFRSKY
jgi:hypothetical protein